MYQCRTKNQSVAHFVMHQRHIRYNSFPDTSTRLLETAACLVNGDQSVSFLANKDGISPLYLAVLAGNVSLVEDMLSRPDTIVHGRTSHCSKA